MANEVIGVVGGGLMGIGIATKCALAGFRTTVVDTNRDRIAELSKSASTILSELIDAELITCAQSDQALGNLHVSDELFDLTDANIAIEAIPEILSAKHQLFEKLERIMRPLDNDRKLHSILAWNSVRAFGCADSTGTKIANARGRSSGIEMIRHSVLNAAF